MDAGQRPASATWSCYIAEFSELLSLWWLCLGWAAMTRMSTSQRWSDTLCTKRSATRRTHWLETVCNSQQCDITLSQYWFVIMIQPICPSAQLNCQTSFIMATKLTISKRRMKPIRSNLRISLSRTFGPFWTFNSGCQPTSHLLISVELYKNAQAWKNPIRI
jgi:hypothetical protein